MRVRTTSPRTFPARIACQVARVQTERVTILPHSERATGLCHLWLFGLSLLSPFSGDSFAETPWRIENWDTQRGLPNNTVTAIAQTGDGFVWVGTDNGLARFDGYQFKSFAPQNTPALTSGRVRHLCADASGGLWVATLEPGMQYLRPRRFVASPSLAPAASSRTISLARSDRGVIHCAMENGEVAILVEGNYRLVGTNLYPSDGSARIFPGTSGEVFIACSTGLTRMASGLNERIVAAREGELKFAAPGRAGWWLATDSALGHWKPGEVPQQVACPTNILRSAKVGLEDRAGTLWLGTEQLGIWCRTAEGATYSFSATNGLASDSVLCLFEDSEGMIWAGTESGGLSRFRNRLFQLPPGNAGFPGEVVTVVCEGRPTELWVGVERRGLHRVQGSSADPVLLSVNHSVQAEAIKHVRSLMFDSTQRLWVGSQDEGLLFVKDRLAEPLAFAPRLRQVSALYEDDRWGLWLGAVTSNALVRIVGEAPETFLVPGTSPSLDVRVFAEDRTGGLWFGTQGNGLFHWDGHDFRRFARAEGLAADTVWALLVDPDDGALWIGTAGGGLSRLKGGVIRTCTRADGLQEDVICQILDDDLGWLWCSSPRGIFRLAKGELRDFFERKSTRIHSTAYGLGDGLPSLECSGGSQPAGCRSRDGRLWWPTAKGLVCMDPKRIQADALPPTVLLDELLVDEKATTLPEDPTRPDDIHNPNRNQIRLGPGPHRIEFRYTALSWKSPEFVRFRHRLSGLDRDWVSAGDDRSAHYNGLAAGDYVFEVSAANRDGVWSPSGAAVRLRIEPHIWQTWWFRLAGAFALVTGAAASVALLLRRRHRLRMERLERLHAVEQERARIAQDIHDDLGASLTEIALLSELAQSQIEEPQVAKGHLDSIFTNARKLARATDEIVWALHPKNNSVEMSLNFITRAAQEFLRAAGVRCRLDFPPELPDVPMSSAMRHHLYLAVKEALNNVVKHSAATEVWLRLKCSADAFVLSIEDNGRGFAAEEVSSTAKSRSASGRGHGVQGMQQRMRAAGGRFEQASEIGRGTVTRFILPLRS